MTASQGREVRNLTDQPRTVNDRSVKEGEHGSNSDSADGGSTIDAESWAYWDRACATLPPMTPEEIEAVAVILRRINARRRRPHPG